MSKKIYIDKRTTVNKGSSQLGLSNQLNLKKYIETIVIENAPVNEWTEVEVNISSAQILAMGTTPVELLPAAGVNKYYNFDTIVVEYSAGATAYTYPSAAAKLKIIGLNSTYMISYLGSSIQNEIAISRGQIAEDLNTTTPYSYPEFENNILTLTTATATDWTLGDGTLKIKIKYKIENFG